MVGFPSAMVLFMLHVFLGNLSGSTKSKNANAVTGWGCPRRTAHCVDFYRVSTAGLPSHTHKK